MCTYVNKVNKGMCLLSNNDCEWIAIKMKAANCNVREKRKATSEYITKWYLLLSSLMCVLDFSGWNISNLPDTFTNILSTSFVGFCIRTPEKNRKIM